jgi:hypothetical protein
MADWAKIFEIGGPIAGSALDYLGNRSAARESNAWQDRAVRMAEQEYADRRPFREQALMGLAASNAPVDSASLFNDPGNPYSAQFDFTRDLGANRLSAPPAAPGPNSPGGMGPIADGGPMTDGQRDFVRDRQAFTDQQYNPVRPPGMPYTDPNASPRPTGRAMSGPNPSRQSVEMQAFLQSIGRGG